MKKTFEVEKCEACEKPHPIEFSFSDNEDGNSFCPNCYAEHLTDEIKKRDKSIAIYKGRLKNSEQTILRKFKRKGFEMYKTSEIEKKYNRKTK